MQDRTEELALAGRVPILLGGEPISLRTLNLDESEEWLGILGSKVAGFDIPTGLDGPASLDALARTPVRAMLELVRAYDVDSVLPPEAELRKQFHQRELYDALRQMVTAEAPFVADVRSVVAAFGPQIRTGVGLFLQAIATNLSVFRPESSTNGRSPTGISIPELSGVGSRSNDSSSSGDTDKSESRESGGKPL